MSTTAKKATGAVNYRAYPDESGHFGPYGGKFVPETLMPALDELEEARRQIDRDALRRSAELREEVKSEVRGELFHRALVMMSDRTAQEAERVFGQVFGHVEGEAPDEVSDAG